MLERANELARQGKKRELIYNELAKQQKEQQQEHVVKKPDPEEALKDAIHPRIDVLKDIPRETALEDASKEVIPFSALCDEDHIPIAVFLSGPFHVLRLYP